MSTLMGDEPELALGDSGEHVTQLQDRLRGLKLLDKFPDGSYDDATQTAVQYLQSDLGLSADGRMTAETWEALDRHMIDQGLHYDHYAGAGNQHWDQAAGAGQDAAQAGAAEGASAAEPYWDGQQWLYYDAATGQWQPTPDPAATDRSGSGDVAPDYGEAAAATHAGPAAPAEEAPVIPHIDNIHPAIRDDERFASFHEFLRETHG